MPFLTNPEQIPGKIVTFFFVIEKSIAMQNSKLEAINSAMDNFVSLLQYYSAAQAHAQIKIAVLEFSNQTRWITKKPVFADQYIWTPLQNTDIACLDPVCLSPVFDELNQKLSKNVFMESTAGAWPPVIMLFLTSPISKIEDTAFNESLSRLLKNNWDKNALKLAFAIGKNVKRELLAEWTGDKKLTLQIKNPEELFEYTYIAGRLSIQWMKNSDIHLSQIISSLICEDADNKEKYFNPVTLYETEKENEKNNENNISSIAISYKNEIAKNFVSVNPSHIDDRIGGKSFFITRKYDGELAVLSWDNNSLVAANSSGKLLKNFSCIQETALQLKKSGVKDIVFAAELYCEESKGRKRISDCLSAISANENLLRIAPFDIISIEGKSFKNELYNEIYTNLQNIFGENEYCKPVRYIEASSKHEIKSIFSEWVDIENSEGLIIRSELPIVYKLKPRITVDAAVVGFSESSDIKGQVRTLLYALRNDNGKYQIIGRTGNGLTTEQKTELYSKLMPMKVASNYLEVDSNRLAFHMIRPELVIELSIGDVISEVTSGSVKNPVLEHEDDSIKQTGICEGYSFISAVIERLREDKTVCIRDVSLSQINIRFPLNLENKIKTNEKKPDSKLLRREVWTKGNAVQKLLVWKTNKEDFGYPAYSASFTIFNPNTQEPFKVDMRISSCESQINLLADQFIVKNIKSGWERE